MQSGRKYLIGFATMGLTTAIAFNIARALLETQEETFSAVGVNSATLHVEPNDLDFGDVAATDDFTWNVPFHNVTDAPIRIARFDTSCGCVGIEPERATIEPGRSQTFRFTLDLLQAWENEPTYRFAESVHAVIPGETGVREVWELRGTVHNVFRFNPPNVDFGKATIVGTVPQPQVVTATPLVAMDGLDCRVVPNHATVDVSRTEDNRFRLKVMPRAVGTVGDYGFRLLLAPQWAGDAKGATSSPHPIGEVLLKAAYEVVEPVESMSGFDHLGVVEIGRTRLETCGLRARLGGPVQVERFDVLSSDLEVLSHDPLGVPTESFVFQVSCTPRRPGERQGTIRFRVTHPDEASAPPTATHDFDFELHYYAENLGAEQHEKR